MWIIKLNHDGSLADKRATLAASLYDALCSTFAKEIAAGDITLMQDLTLTLTSPLLQFKTGVYKLTKKQKNFLEKFTPKLLTVLKKYREKIKYISLNGHTSTIWKNASTDSAYLKNMKLSSKRAYETIDALYNSSKQKDRKVLRELLEAHSLAYKEKIMKYKKEDVLQSQRVTLKMELK